jgi:ADP-ribosylglycohydrolase
MKRDSLLVRKAAGCLIGGLIGDAIGTPSEGKDYRDIEAQLGWLDDFTSDGTDDTVMRNLLAEALIRTEGYATLDDWAQVWLDHWSDIFGVKLPKFFVSVVHTAQKLRHHALPRMAGMGNMPSSSSAMGIAPVGIVNACNPRQAALQAYNLAGLIHIYDVGFCQDGAAAIAAAVAEAMKPDATVASVLAAATAYILPLSGSEMLARIDAALTVARETGEYSAFRAAIYDRADAFFGSLICDARETVPLTLALLYLGGNDLERCVTYAANFGRDADTLGSMVGSIVGALKGIDGIKPAWLDKVRQVAAVDQEALAERLADAALAKHQRERAAQDLFAAIAPTI